MDAQKSIEKVSTPSMGTGATMTVPSVAIQPRQCIAQNFLLIWIDASMDASTQGCQNKLAQLRNVVNDVNIFTQCDAGIDFLTEVDDLKAFLIVEGTISQHIVPLIHDIPQLDTIYLFCGNESGHEQWTKQWIKIKGMHMDIEPICEALELAAKQCNQDSIAMSFVSMGEGASSQNLNELEPSFMYTQIFKEILLGMEHNEKSIKDLAIHCRKFYNDNMHGLNIINDFEHNYRAKSPIWWYTRECFTYLMLNRALRMLESDTIINMGFFIRDLHEQIQQLHQKQVGSYHGKSFTVYRGQGLLKTDFEKLATSKNGLMSFNNFLSTSKNQDVSLRFAKGALTKNNMVGILFKMTADPSVSSVPFASIGEVSFFKNEEEILFSMHTVFRIGEINKIDNNDSLYQVDLKLTADDDPQLHILTEHIRKEVVGPTGWVQLGTLLIKLRQFEKAEELFNALLEQTSDEGEKTLYYNQLGYIKDHQGDYQKAIEYYEKKLKILQKILPPNDPEFATYYNNIGTVYMNMGEYSKALWFYEKVLEMTQKTLPLNHYLLACSNNNIGEVYRNIGEYSKALSFYDKALEIQQKTLPTNHPLLTTSYKNIGGVYCNMGEYSEALSFYEKALEIQQKTLPPNHPSFTTSINNIAEVYSNMGEYSKALSFYEKALEIQQKNPDRNHPSLAKLYNGIGLVYCNIGNYSKALSFHEKALEIFEKILPADHPHLATSCNNIGLVYNNMREYAKALSSHEKALEIQQKTLPANHPHLATSYNNTGSVYRNMGKYAKALSFYEKALEIQQKTLPPNHPDLAISINNIGAVYGNMGEYSKALLYFECALNIFQISLPANHSNIQNVRKTIEIVKKKL